MCFWKKKKNKNVTAQNVCPRCGIAFGEGDTFCRYCGFDVMNNSLQTGRQSFAGSFQPNANMGATMYGPPLIARTHTCPNCGNTWEDYGQNMNGECYCPNCGYKASAGEN